MGGGVLLYSVENFSEDEFPFLFLMVSVRLFLTPCFTVLICCVCLELERKWSGGGWWWW